MFVCNLSLWSVCTLRTLWWISPFATEREASIKYGIVFIALRSISSLIDIHMIIIYRRYSTAEYSIPTSSYQINPKCFVSYPENFSKNILFRIVSNFIIHHQSIRNRETFIVQNVVLNVFSLSSSCSPNSNIRILRIYSKDCSNKLFVFRKSRCQIYTCS